MKTVGVLMTAALSNYNSLHDLSILYVEDDRRIREQPSIFLRRRRGEVFTANDGAEGVSRFEAHHTDIVVTAHNDVQFLTRCIEVGVDHYVFKPMDLNELSRILSASAAASFSSGAGKIKDSEGMGNARREESE